MMTISLKIILVATTVLCVANCAPVPSTCSTGCICNVPLHLVDCSGGRLSEIPLNLPGSSEILRLDLHSNQIHVLDSRGDLEAYQNLEQLDLDDNDLDVINDNVLEPLVNLKRLSVHKNKLCNVSVDTFHGLKSLTEIDLSNNQIRSLKTGAFVELTILEVLNLSENLIETIDAGAFEGLGNLRRLILTGNVLSSIPTASFSDVTLLNSLDLDRNQVSTVETLSFTMLVRLNSLNLDNNRITIFSDDAFGTDTKLALKELSLVANQLDRIPKDAITRLEMLEVLDFSQNPVTVIEPLTFDHLLHLRILRINSIPQLKVVKKRALNNLPLLRELSMHSNQQLETVEPGTFQDVPNLEVLDLHSNALTTIDSNLIEGIEDVSTFDVRFNPLVCDCSLLWLRKRLVENTSLETSLATDVRCASPANLAQRQLVNIAEEDVTCDQNADTTKKSHDLEDQIMIATIAGFCLFLFFVAIFVVYRFRNSFLANSPYNAAFLTDYQRAYQRTVKIETQDSVKSTAKLFSGTEQHDHDNHPQNW